MIQTLHHIRQLLRALDTPQDTLSVIHIAGTNGKGSTAAYLSQMLTGSGCRVGRFTSPHLIAPFDTICIDGEPALTQDEFDACMTHLETIHTHASYFERQTALAFLVFAGTVRKAGLERPIPSVDVALVECGMGGRNDATNVVLRPLVTVLTSIGMDHETVLGPHLEDIVINKCGILRRNVPVVMSVQRHVGVEGWIREQAELVGTDPCSVANADQIRVDGQMLVIGEHRIRAPLGTSPAQVDNLSTAWCVMQRVCPLLHVLWSTATCAQAVEKTVWRGRFSRHGYGALKDIIVDGAHNTDGAQALRAGLVNFPSTSRAWVLGMARHKNHLDVLSNLGIHEGDVVVACSFSPVESMPWVQPVSTEVLLATLHDLHSNQPTHSTETIAQALEWLNTQNIQQVIVCGSLYLVADFYRLIQKCG